MLRIAVCSAKGGVGKTTLAVNLAAAYARRGLRVLLIDADPQSDASYSLGIASPAYTLADVLTGRVPLQLAAVAARANLDLLAGDMRLAGTTASIDAFKPLTAAGAAYTVLIADTPPSTFGGLTLAAMAALGRVLLPVLPEALSLRHAQQVDSAAQAVGAELAWIVAGNASQQRRLTADVLERLRQLYPGRVAKTFIRTDAMLAAAPAYGRTIYEHAPAGRGAADIDQLASEVMNHAKGKRPASR